MIGRDTSDGIEDEPVLGSSNGSSGGLSGVTTVLREHRDQRRLLKAEQTRDDKRTVEAVAREQLDDALAARAGYEANQRVVDPLEKRRKSLPIALLGAIVVALVDGLPAYWAAEALGHGRWSTVAVTVILVAALAGFAALMSFFAHGGERRMFWLAAALTLGMVAVQSGLRLRYLLVVSEAPRLDAMLESMLLAGITIALVWVGYVLLHQAEPAALWRERRVVARLEAQADEWRARAVTASARAFEAQQLLRHARRSRSADLVERDRDDLLPAIYPTRRQGETADHLAEQVTSNGKHEAASDAE